MNSPLAVLGPTVDSAAQVVSSWGFTVTPEILTQYAKDVGEASIVSRAGGAPTLAVGMAHILSQITGPSMMAFWYHFAILFEALFILTAVDAGTRAGRFMLQDLMGTFVPAMRRTDSFVANITATGLCVAAQVTSSIKASSILLAASTPCGLCSVLQTRCWQRLPSRCVLSYCSR